ncbi:endolytic transglycosylase MltG [Enterococcus sp. MMGLQ5-2]|nr:endolytic transglycosylase MltG [Enterococcus sp. MMGLQ5-2]MBS7585272.1 endolytic transglycosylase MltG [Enterococcus sp. MMGLQ5-1]
MLKKLAQSQESHYHEASSMDAADSDAHSDDKISKSADFKSTDQNPDHSGNLTRRSQNSVKANQATVKVDDFAGDSDEKGAETTIRANNKKAKKQVKNQKTRKKREDRMVRQITFAVIIALIALMSLGGYLVYDHISTAVQPLNTKDNQQITVDIPIGSSNKEIGNILEKKKIIRSGMIFNYYTKFHNLAGFKGGYYNFSPNQTIDEIAAALQEGGSEEPQAAVAGKILIPEGYTIDQIAEAVTINVNEKSKPKSKFTSEAFKQVITNQDFINSMVQKYPDLLTSASQATDVRYVLEGYLFPATYDYAKATTVQELVEQMISTTNDKLEPYYSTIQEKGYTVQEVLTLASLVEKEGVKTEDRRKIAQVFLNRLAADMPIQSDISVLYALNEHKELLSIDDTKVDSPYNLYLNTGFGPGPFNSPSLESIQAVLTPEATDDLYFVADTKTGEVYFAKTYDEHLALVEKYVNNQE